MTSILVFVEAQNGRISRSSLLVLRWALAWEEARDLEVLSSGPLDDETVRDLAVHGVKRLWLCGGVAPAAEPGHPFALLSQALRTIWQRSEVKVLLAAHSGISKHLAAHFAGKTAKTCQFGISKLRRQGAGFEVERVVFGGRIVLQISCEEGEGVFTILPEAIGPPLSRKVDFETIVLPQTVRSELQFSWEAPNRPSESLETAEIVVTGGMGFRTREDLAVLEKFADSLNAAIGYTRPLVDAHLGDPSLQIGQTGKTVSPKIYWAIGVSGALHHWVGMRKSQVIVAINKDPMAPIFKYCNYGIVGDLFHILPVLTKLMDKNRMDHEKSVH